MAIDGDVAILRPAGIGRYFETIFLGVWLTGWAIGETVAIVVMTSVPVTFVVFLLAWLALWTVGGMTAGWRFLRGLAGADRIALVPVGLEVIRRAGPFKRTHRFDRSDLRRIRIRSHDKALVADTSAGTRVLSDLGSPVERESLCGWLQSRLNVGAYVPRDPAAAPPGWIRTNGDSGEIRLARPSTGRRIVGLVLWIVTGVVTYSWITESSVSGINVWPAVMVALLAFASTWVVWAREEWIVRPGYLERRLQLGSWVKIQTFAGGQLEITRTVDSDGDWLYTLIVRAAEKPRTFDSALHDDADLVECARWLETATGFPLTIRR
jgi:hypothetical protein